MQRREYEAHRAAVFDLHARACIGYLPPVLTCPVRVIAPGDEPWRHAYGFKATETDIRKVAHNFEIRTFSGKRASYVIAHRVGIAEQINSWLTAARSGTRETMLGFIPLEGTNNSH